MKAKFYQKTVALLLGICMVISLLAGCGNTGGAADTNENGQTSSDADASEGTAADNSGSSGEYPVIRMNYHIVFGSSDEAEIEEKLNVIMREKAGAEVDLVGIEFGNLVTQTNLMLTGGDDALDLFTSFWYTSISNLVANGQIIPLDDLLESDGQDVLAQFEGFEEYLNCARVGQNLYGTPSVYAWCSENLYMVQRSTSEAAGIDWSQVNDLDSMTEAMLAMKQTSPDKYFIPGSTETYWIPKDIDYFGDTNFLGVLTNPTESTTVENYYESDYFLNFLDNVKIWKENDLISPDPLSNSSPTLLNLQAGIVDGTPGYSWDAQVGIASSGAQNQLDVVGAAVTEPLATSGDVTTYMWHISSFCEDPAAAMRVLGVLYSDPVAAQLVANGIEGLEYVINENGQMEYPEGKGMADVNWPAASMAVWPNVMLCETWSHEQPDIYDQMKEKNRVANKSLALGFQFDSTAVANEMTACANVVAQYYMPLMYAESDIDETLPVFQQALKDAGVDTIIAEKQRQLDEWLAAK